MFLFLLLLLCDDDDDDDFAIVTEEEDDDNFAIVVVFKNVVLLTLPLPDGSPFCVNNRVLFRVVIGVMLMVVTDNMLMFSYLFIRACVYWCVCVRYVACKDIKNWWSRWIEKEAQKKNEGKKQHTEKKKYTRERERERERERDTFIISLY